MAAKDLYNKDLYKVLGVSKTDDATAVKKAYRKLAKDLHPDRTKGDKKLEERFKEVSEAYEVLSDPKKRSEYEDMREARGPGRVPKRPSGTQSNRGSQSFGFQGNQDSDPWATGSPSDAFFENLFGRVNPGTHRGRDLLTEVKVYFRDAVMGKEISFDIAQEVIKVRIPIGIKDGTKIKVKGRGGFSSAGDERGDLFVIINVLPHPVFTRIGNDLSMLLQVTYSEMTLGGDISVPTFYGETVTIRIAPGTENGKLLRIKGKGIKGNSVPGDLLVSLYVQIPKKLSVSAARALKSFALFEEENSPRKDLKKLVDL